MEKYYSNADIRKKVQIAISAVQIALMISAILFMSLFVFTPAPSTWNFSGAAIAFAVLWGGYWLAQLIFAAVTFKKTPEKNKIDVAFLATSVIWIGIGIGIYGIITLLLTL